MMSSRKVHRFSASAKQLLRSIADQPWSALEDGKIRILAPELQTAHPARVCPLCFIANRKVGKWRYRSDYLAAAFALDMSSDDADAIANAADFSNDPNRRELVRLLGGLRKKGPTSPRT